MSSKGSTSPSPSPSPSPETLPAHKSEESSKGQDQSPESASGGASPSSSPEKDAANDTPEASSSGDSKSVEPSTGAEQPEVAQPVVANAHVQGDWQAIFSPPHGMYYFYNMRTKETTWTNPLSPHDPSATASASASARISASEAAAAAGIDPELAYLDPTLVAGPSVPAAFSYSAKFNARTGAFARPDARDPDHVSEYERMKRMNNFYFDMDEWQKEVEKRHQEEEEEEAGKKRKKLTKKDLESFKERKKQKKLAKTAWLRT